MSYGKDGVVVRVERRPCPVGGMTTGGGLWPMGTETGGQRRRRTDAPVVRRGSADGKGAPIPAREEMLPELPEGEEKMS